jgi:hypothetical protein
MDLGVIVATLSLLISALAELREISKDNSNSKEKKINQSLLQLIVVLTNIIELGEMIMIELVGLHTGDTAFQTQKDKILKLIKQQIRNMNEFAKAYSKLLSYINSDLNIPGSSAIEIYIPRQTVRGVRRIIPKKRILLKVVAWKLLEGRITAFHLSMAANLWLENLKDSKLRKNQETTESLKIARKISIKIPDTMQQSKRLLPPSSPPFKEELVRYYLNSHLDVLRLVQIANSQLDELRKYREQLINMSTMPFAG